MFAKTKEVIAEKVTEPLTRLFTLAYAAISLAALALIVAVFS